MVEMKTIKWKRLEEDEISSFHIAYPKGHLVRYKNAFKLGAFREGFYLDYDMAPGKQTFPFEYEIKIRDKVTAEEKKLLFSEYIIDYANIESVQRCPVMIKCTCGAKHTSFPKHHLEWCDEEVSKRQG